MADYTKLVPPSILPEGLAPQGIEFAARHGADAYPRPGRSERAVVVFSPKRGREFAFGGRSMVNLHHTLDTDLSWASKLS